MITIRKSLNRRTFNIPIKQVSEEEAREAMRKLKILYGEEIDERVWVLRDRRKKLDKIFKR